MIDLAVLSDLHGYLPEINPCELVLLCGDQVPLNVQRSYDKTKKWYFRDFKKWAEELPCDKVIFIAGNHECYLPNHYKEYKEKFNNDSKVTYLCHEEYIYKGTDEKEYRIFGTPYCHRFGNWAFMADDEDLKEIYRKIPENLDILISHDAPYGACDVLLQAGYYTGRHIGNIPLREAILNKAPKYVFVGHLHSASKSFESLEESLIINCSIKDERYEPVYEPLYLKLTNE